MERVKRKMLAYILSPVSSSCIHFVAGAFALGQHILCTDLYLKSCVSVASHIALVQLHSDSSRRPNNKKRRGLPRLRAFVCFRSPLLFGSSVLKFWGSCTRPHAKTILNPLKAACRFRWCGPRRPSARVFPYCTNPNCFLFAPTFPALCTGAICLLWRSWAPWLFTVARGSCVICQ